MDDARRPIVHLALLVLLLAPGRSWGELAFQPTAIDLGEVRTGTLLTREIKLVNQAHANAVKLELKGSCACLKGWVENGWSEIAAGRQATINLRINTLAAPAGQQRWRLTVRYELQGQARSAALDVLANVVPEIVVQPSQVLVSSQGPTSHEFSLYDLRAATFRIKKVETSNPHLLVSLGDVKTDDQGREARIIKLDVGPNLPPGKYDEHLTIHTDDPHYRQLRIEVSINRRPRQRFAVLPDAIDVVISSSEPVARRIVSLRDQRGEMLQIDRIETDHAALACTWKVLANGQAAALTITVDGTKIDAGELTGTVHVHLKAPEVARVRIPVSCVKR